MTVLVDWQIEKEIERGNIKITPFERDNIQPNSLDMRLSNSFGKYEGGAIDVADPKTFEIQSLKASSITIPARGFLLAETKEKVTLPPNIVATIEGKSSLARLGLSLHQTGGWIDAGFSGTITLELFNANSVPIKLYAGMKIGQLVFEKTEKCHTPYNKKEGAKYNNQEGATPSRYKLD